MKRLLSTLPLVLLSVCLLAESRIEPEGSAYTSSAPPGTNITYWAINECSNNPGSCKYTWSVTNGEIIGNSS